MTIARTIATRLAARALVRAIGVQQQALFEHTARGMGDSPKEIKNRHIDNRQEADPAYGERFAKALGVALSEVKP